MDQGSDWKGTRALWAALLLFVCAPAHRVGAEDAAEAARRVRFSVEAAREVPNDWIRAVVGISAEDADAASLADGVNRTMAWALERSRAETRVVVESGSYHTQPVHEKGRLRRWRASQFLVLESSDTEAMTRLVGALQERLQLQSFEFSVSHETRARVEEKLVEEVLGAFRARAELVRKGLGAKGYAIDEMSIGTSGDAPLPMRAMRMEAFSSAAPEPPAVEAGNTRIVVNASGAILLE